MSKSRRKNRTPSFIHEFLLCTTMKDEHTILVRMDCARQLFNTSLGEIFKRVRKMRDSEEWKHAINIPKTKENAKERSDAFKKANEIFGFKDSSIQAFAVKAKNSCHIKDHLGVHICQKIATKAFSAVQQYVFTNRGKPRFKGINQLNSVEGKNNETGIRWINNQVVWDGLILKPVFDHKDKKGIQLHALSSKVKYVRIVRRVINGQNKFFAQLILEGHPKCVHPVGKGVVGLDLRPSSIACVPPLDSGKDAFLEPFCKELKKNQREIRLLQRKMDRSLRAMNPDAYDEKGKVKTGVKLKKSKNYEKLKIQLNEEYRKSRETRKKLHGTLVNRIFSMGNIVNSEKISYRAWQKLFGRSIGFRAPGLFISLIKRKADAMRESAGVLFNEINTWSTKLSQVCHNCGNVKKKSLKERWHNCECGMHVQRDLYSAFLAQYVIMHGDNEPKDRLDICQAKIAWPSAEPLLLSAVLRCNETMNGEQRLSSFGLSQRSNGLQTKEEIVQDDGLNVPHVNNWVPPNYSQRLVSRRP